MLIAKRLLISMLLAPICEAGATNSHCDISAQEINQRFAMERQQQHIPGIVWLVADRRGTVASGALGVADIDSGRPMDANMPVRLGSITKIFNALAVLRLVEANKLALQDPVDHWIDTGLYHNSYQEPLRVEHLLEHTSGFPDMSGEEFSRQTPFSQPLKISLAEFTDRHILAWPPGRHPVYSNLNAGVLGRVIERAASQPYEEVVEEQVLLPLGFSGAGYRQVANLATGYDSDGATPIPYWQMHYRPLGGLNVMAPDMAKLISALLNKGTTSDGRRWLSPGSIDRMETLETSLGARAGLDYGYALGIYHQFRDGVLFLGHGGDADGHLAKLGYSRQLGCGYFIAINAFNTGASSALERIMQRQLAEGSVKMTPPAPVNLSRRQAEWVIGNYKSVTWRFPGRPLPVATVLWEEGNLWLKQGTRTRKLIAVSPQLFRFSGEPRASVAFAREDGETFLQMEDYNFKRLE